MAEWENHFYSFENDMRIVFLGVYWGIREKYVQWTLVPNLRHVNLLHISWFFLYNTGAVCIQLTHFSYDDVRISVLGFIINHQIGNMTHMPLLRVMSWNNFMRYRRCLLLRLQYWFNYTVINVIWSITFSLLYKRNGQKHNILGMIWYSLTYFKSTSGAGLLKHYSLIPR